MELGTLTCPGKDLLFACLTVISVKLTWTVKVIVLHTHSHRMKLYKAGEKRVTVTVFFSFQIQKYFLKVSRP